MAFCGASYLEVVNNRDEQVPRKADFLAALLPLMCIPALLSLCSGLVKWLVIFSLVPRTATTILDIWKRALFWFYVINYGILIFRKDDNWKLSRGVFVFVFIGLLLLLGGISAVTVIITPWTVSVYIAGVM